MIIGISLTYTYYFDDYSTSFSFKGDIGYD